jgi:hypothetical protein
MINMNVLILATQKIVIAYSQKLGSNPKNTNEKNSKEVCRRMQKVDSSKKSGHSLTFFTTSTNRSNVGTISLMKKF